MKRIGRGVTRSVYQVGPWAMKVPGGLGKRTRIRGWLANQSEWRNRWRTDVVRPVFTVGHVLLFFPLAGEAPRTMDFVEWVEAQGYMGDESKWSSWGTLAGDWLLVDYDTCWQDPGWLATLYRKNQKRLGRKWSRL